METIVCIKRVPDIAEIEIEVAPDGRSVKTDDLAFGLSEWDLCAVEEAIQLREKHGGSITVFTVGDEESEDVLRKALAMGADEAFRISESELNHPEAHETARLLSAAIADRSFDLILTGSVSGDSGAGQVGGMLAAMLDVPQVALATAITVDGGLVRVQHEVENGLERIVEVDAPALVTVQTGINEPRYVSIRGIRKVRRLEIPVLVPDLTPEEAWTTVIQLSQPISESRAEILEGSPEKVVDELVERLKERGGI